MAMVLQYGVFAKRRFRGSEWLEASSDSTGPFKAGYAWMCETSRKLFGGPYLAIGNANRYQQRALHKWLARQLMNTPYREAPDITPFIGMEVLMISVNAYSVTISMTNGDSFSFRHMGWGAFPEETFEDRMETYSEPMIIKSYKKGKLKLSNRHVFKFPADRLKFNYLSLG